jgi:hypothetical protein
MPFERITMAEREERRRLAELRREQWPKDDFNHQELRSTGQVLATGKAVLEELVVAVAAPLAVVEGKERLLAEARTAINAMDQHYKMVEIRARYGSAVAETFQEESADLPDLSAEEEKRLLGAIKQHKPSQRGFPGSTGRAGGAKPYDREEDRSCQGSHSSGGAEGGGAYRAGAYGGGFWGLAGGQQPGWQGGGVGPAQQQMWHHFRIFGRRN